VSHRARACAVLLASVALAGCRGADARSAARAPDADSAYAAAVAEFSAGLERPDAFSGGAPSREALVRRFVSALAAGDTVALRGLLLTRAEFAHLVYPSSPFVRAPYRQAPQVTWLLLTSAGDKGLRRLGARLAGEPVAYRRHHCGEPVPEGANRLWRGCTVTIALRGNEATARLFGVIVERTGRFKFASFENDL
jgi:hypothetical protein